MRWWTGRPSAGDRTLRTPEDDKVTVTGDTADTFALDGDPVALPETTEEKQAHRYGPPDPLGAGGLGEVYLVFDRVLGRSVAKKVLREGVGAASRSRFARESKVTAQLEHPSIIPVYDSGFDEEGRRFYTMKHVRGRSLGACLEGARTLADRLTWIEPFCDACDALAYAHSREVVHRDLKPDNIMVGEFGECLVLDWGLARTRDDVDEEPDTAERPVNLQDSFRTRAGAIGGTPAYMSPEQALGSPLGPASDIFGLGAILYEILTGVAPYAHAATIEEVLDLARKGGWRPVRSLARDAPAELVAVAERALDPDPSRRYQSASELGSDLRRWLRGQRVAAYRYSTLELTQRFLGRNAVPIVAGGVGVLLAVVFAAIGLTSTLVSVTAGSRATNLALADARLQLAQQALRDREHLDAYRRAVSVLDIRPDPDARGILAALHGTSIPVRTPVSDHPCARIAVVEQGVVCVHGAQLSLLDAETFEPRWTVEDAGERLVRVEHGRVVLHSRARNALRVFDLATGERLSEHPDRLNAFFEPDGTLRTHTRELAERHPPSGPEPVTSISSIAIGWWPIDRGDLLLSVSGRGVRTVDGEPEGFNLHPESPITSVHQVEEDVWVFGTTVERYADDLSVRHERLDPEGRVLRFLQADDMLLGLKTDGRMRLWDAERRVQEVGTFEALGDMALLGGSQLLTSSEAGIASWTLRPGRPWRADRWGGRTVLHANRARTHAVTCGLHEPTVILELPGFTPVAELPIVTQLCGWADEDEAIAISFGGPGTVSPAHTWSPAGVGEREVVEGLMPNDLIEGRLLTYSDGSFRISTLEGQTLLDLPHSPRFVGPRYVQDAERLYDLEGKEVLRSAQPAVFLGEEWMLTDAAFDTEVRRRSTSEVVCSVPRIDVAAESARYLIGSTWAGTILVYDKRSLERGRCEPVARMEGHGDRISVLQADETYLLSRSWDQTVRLWSLEALSISPKQARRWLNGR